MLFRKPLYCLNQEVGFCVPIAKMMATDKYQEESLITGESTTTLTYACIFEYFKTSSCSAIPQTSCPIQRSADQAFILISEQDF